MDAAKRELLKSWLLKARNDLDTARQVSTLPGGHLDTAIYHCQQCAEKSVKALLLFHDHPLERTHDIERLISILTPLEPTAATWADEADLLTPYAVAYRYPGAATNSEPDRPEFDEAFLAAEYIFRGVLALVPTDTHP